MKITTFPLVTQMVDLADALPHRPPMSLLDKMVSVEGGTVHCVTTVREDSTFLRDGKMPAIVAIEYMAQAVGAVLGLWVLLEGGRVAGGLLLGAPILELDVDFFEIGDTLDVRCSHVWGADEVQKFDCVVERDGVSLARATLNVLRIHPEGRHVGAGDQPGAAQVQS